MARSLRIQGVDLYSMGSPTDIYFTDIKCIKIQIEMRFKYLKNQCLG